MAEKKEKTSVPKKTPTIKNTPAKTAAVPLDAAAPTQAKTEKKKFSFPFKKKQNQSSVKEVQRFRADADIGLSEAQVQERIEQGLVNKTGKKYSKSYRSIFLGNICTFFC